MLNNVTQNRIEIGKKTHLWSPFTLIVNNNDQMRGDTNNVWNDLNIHIISLQVY